MSATSWGARIVTPGAPAHLLLSVFASGLRFNEEVKHIKVVEKDNWIHITEAKKFESLLVCP